MDQSDSRRALLGVGAAVLFAAGLQASPASATLLVSGRVQATAIGFGAFINPDIQQWVGAARDLNAQNLYHSATTGVPSAESHVFINAHWNSADSGTVDFSDNGITISQGPRIDDDVFTDYSASWEYRFVADADGVLDFDLQAAFTGNQSDIGTWRVGAADLFDPAKIVLQDQDGYAAGGNTLELGGSLRLEASHTYVVVLQNSGSSSNVVVPGFLQGNESGTLTWSITPDAAAVPEPGSWALIIVGFAGAGATLRAGRRRPSPA